MSWNKIIYQFLFLLSLLLFFSSLLLYYPLGYDTNILIYSAFVLYSIFSMPEDYRQRLSRAKSRMKDTGLACGSLFLVAFILTGGFIFIPFEKLFDFDDETEFVNKNYRVVTTSQVVRSGGQSYIAVLKRSWLSEHCVFKAPDPRVWGDPKVANTPQGAALIVRKNNGFCCDTIFLAK